MIDKDFEMEMEKVQELSYEEYLDLMILLTIWDRIVEELNRKFDPRWN